ncbi:MAG TPA: hypothetical protein PKA37_01520, partial [Planctomycetota bacterium]|nr:hypothetical protein [Planctomycetota bacterium]
MVLHLRLLLLLVLASLLPQVPAQSDLKLVGHRLKTFVSTKGASELGNSVLWKVSATTFQKPPERMGAFWAFEPSGVLLLVEVGLPDLEIVQRRGGSASLR